ncbi:hypothetical protein Z945_1877 [Sulfitobacter noctilucae]|uniref:hypothetical protein n=1 Tax=Sulfitobacter noctilucae TaxID=1342302 RepID=UPI00046A1203|nr:hypothetical protein [Sulfitobacter noctilucae]KIN60894.1 hypothetical protein Z945_1877 [Sulfitobacter noctilucae]
MRSVRRHIGASLLFAGALWPIASSAQDQTPLSVIDWLGTRVPNVQQVPAALPLPKEPPVAQTAVAPAVNVEPLSEGGPRVIGLVPSRITGLPADLWVGSDLSTVTALLDKVPDLQLPAAQSLLYTVLLAESFAPGNSTDAGNQLALARVEKLVAQGALDPAQSLIEQAGVTLSPAHFELWMQISLLSGTEDRACSVLAATPHLSRNYANDIFCDARAQNWPDATLTLGTARALGLLPEAQLALFDRFLDPEASDMLPPLVPPRQMDPLSFRMFEAIGDPVPTSTLPRAYAVADLRDVAGWKAQLEAAERLTLAGALPDNRLLGLYTERRAAASGGIWDRVAALQRFETALETRSAEAVAKTLPPLWTAMGEAGLEVTFATLFADRLTGFDLTGSAKRIQHIIALLSPNYEAAASSTQNKSFAVQIAAGDIVGVAPSDPTEAAIHAGFTNALPRADLLDMVKQGRLGESILHSLILLHKGAGGSANALSEGLATLRALGLEDSARRAALQILLLERR